MRTRLILAGLAACIVLPGIFASDANADHNRHWFYDSYNQYEDESFNYYVPKRRRAPAATYYEDEYLTERQYRRLLRAERRKARRLRAERRKAAIRKRWRDRQIRYDLAPETFKRKQQANVPLPRSRPFAESFNSADSIRQPLESKSVETATLGNSPVTIVPIEPTPAPAPSRTAAPEPVKVEPIAPIEAKPVKEKSVRTATLEPAPVKREPAKKVEAATEKKVKGRISCKSAEKIVAGFGFSDIEAKSCDGKSYDFGALRDGKPFTITLSSTSGELTEVRRD
ncbi:MAG: hypothetical protein HKN11_10845 [Rhizobiales bacterium]|nr:hypothetical protein [Hyphomicrobiales bacterium]